MLNLPQFLDTAMEASRMSARTGSDFVDSLRSLGSTREQEIKAREEAERRMATMQQSTDSLAGLLDAVKSVYRSV